MFEDKGKVFEEARKGQERSWEYFESSVTIVYAECTKPQPKQDIREPILDGRYSEWDQCIKFTWRWWSDDSWWE